MPPLSVRVVFLPALLTPADVDGHVVVGFDVLRATTTIAAALAAGVSLLQLHPTLDSARAALAAGGSDGLLIGEERCLKPADFHLGNSPGQFTSEHAGKSAHMATTNGTRALLRPFTVGTPRAVLAGSLANRLAVARACLHLLPTGGGVTLLCAGTDGEVAYEDVLGCGAVLESFVNLQCLGPVNDGGLVAMGVWTFAAAGIVRAKEGAAAYPSGFRLGQGAKNLIAAGLSEDVQLAARPDTLAVVPQVSPTGVVTALELPPLPGAMDN